MIEKIMKAVKSGNKKRGRNITIGAVVGMLLSCTAAMGADDKYLWIRENSGEIEFNTKETTDVSGAGGNWKSVNPYEGNEWNEIDKTYTNNMELSISTNNGKSGYYDISYVVKISENLSEFNFINNSSITIKGMEDKDGYGVWNTGTIGNITNNEYITAAASAPENGYETYFGIRNDGTIENITNNGFITVRGKGNPSGIVNSRIINGMIKNNSLISITADYGSGIYNRGTTGTITNTGLITVINENTAGIENGGILNSNSLTNLTNDGSIETTGNGEINGVWNAGTIGNITNNGLITATGSDEGNGICNKYEITTLTNSGSIVGTGSKGHGIYNEESGKINGTLTNSGLIIGNSSSGTGNGIHNGERKSISALVNTGIIYGSTNAVKNSGTIGSFNNYGLLISGSTNVVDGISIEAYNDAGGQNKINNYGLAFTADGSGSYENHGASDANHNFGKTWDAAIDGVAYKIRNVEADVNSIGGAITNI
ncbi:autotransporter domain-containing protein, partial [Fusobacterium ulcerans]